MVIKAVGDLDRTQHHFNQYGYNESLKVGERNAQIDFNQGWIFPNVNSCHVVLIPKFKETDAIKNYRPISPSKFKFKIITNILADTLFIIAPIIISYIKEDSSKNNIFMSSSASHMRPSTC